MFSAGAGTNAASHKFVIVRQIGFSEPTPKNFASLENSQRRSYKAVLYRKRQSGHGEKAQLPAGLHYSAQGR